MKQFTRHYFFCLVITAILLSLTACGGKDQLIYQVTGTAVGAKVTYTDGDGNSQTETVTLPWEASFDIGNRAEFFLSADNIAGQGDIICAVLLNEKELGWAGADYYVSCEGNFYKGGDDLSVVFSSSRDVLPDGSAAGPQVTPTPTLPTATPTPTPPTATSTPSASDRFEQGSAYYEQGELDKALVEFKEAIKLDPDNPDVHRNIGTVYMELGKWEEAVAAYEQAIALSPDFGEAYGDITAAYTRLDDLEKAIAAGKKAIELAPDYATAHNNLGSVYLRQGQHDKAVTEYQEAIRLDPDDVMPYYNLGLVYYKQGQVEQAMAKWKEAAQIDPNHPNTHKNLGIGYLELDQAVEALTEFELYLQLAPDAPDRAAVEEEIARLKALNAASSEETASGVKTYDNKYIGLVMEYPADWVLKDAISDERAVIFLGSNEDFANTNSPGVFAQLGATIQIVINDLGQFPATSLIELQEDFIENTYPPMTPVNEASPISVPGELGNAIEGVERSYIAEMDDETTLRFGVTTLVQSGRVIEMVAIWGADYEEQVLPTIQAILSTVVLKLTTPEVVMNAIFLAAREEDYSILSQLCHSGVDNDSDTQMICDMETANADTQAEFANYFKNGKLIGRAYFGNDGTQAQVPFLFGPDGDQEEVMTFVLKDNKWYLYDF